MEQFGSQMRAFAHGGGGGDRDSAGNLAQPSRPANGASKPPSEPPQKAPNHGCADVKPRLTKEQHDILERHFQQQHKPSTNTKKGFAETLGVPVDKINNWFQNRRAKVKQDLKKQMSQLNMNMNMNMYQTNQMPIVTPQYPAHIEQPLPQQLGSDYYSVNADISPTALPVDHVEVTSALDSLGPQMPLHQFDLHALRSIPETNRSASYNPNAVMQSFMAAAAGPPYMPSNNSTSITAQDPTFAYDTTSLSQAYPNDLAFSMPATTLPTDSTQSNDYLNGHGDYSNFDYASLTSTTVSGSVPARDGTASTASEPSPFSGAQSTATTQSSGGPHASSVTSIASVYSNWTDDQNSATEMNAANQCEETFDHAFNLPQGSASDPAATFWASNQQAPQTQAYQHGDLYSHSNASAQAILSSPEEMERKLSAHPFDLEQPRPFTDDEYSRRNSSTSALANGLESVSIQNGQASSDGFKQPAQPSTIASRRQRRPAALNSSALRSASYSSGMPSPGANHSQGVDHSLRRIRSTGITNAGRIQKTNPGSAQRSPLNFTFAEAAASPKFARTASGLTTTAGPAGSLAPPTPLTPNEMSRFPYWQSNTVIRSHPPMPEHSSPESLNVSWTVEPQSAGLYSNAASPPSTPLDARQIKQVQLASESMHRDTPPQSAPATQESFPRTAFMAPPQMPMGFRSTTDLTIVQPKPSHFRRPSLPDTSHNHLGDSHMQFPVQYGNVAGELQFNYDLQFKEPVNGLPKGFVPASSHDGFALQPSATMPEFFVHEYSPPQAGGQALPRRPSESQVKNYIFANQGPRDFRS